MHDTSQRQPLPPTTAPPGRRPKILVADDSVEMRSLLAEVLEDAGYEVTTAGSGARALSLMSESPPDLLITDLLMPGMSGFTLRALMLRRPNLASVRVVVLTAYWDRPSETLDVAAVLAKPLNIDRLLETVRRLTADESDPSAASAAPPSREARG